MIELILLIIPFLYNIIITYLTMLPRQFRLLNCSLRDENIYILSNNYCTCNKNIDLFLGLFYKDNCNLCKVNNIININDDINIEYLINKLEPNSEVSFILDSNDTINIKSNLVAYIIKKNNIKLTTYIPKFTSNHLIAFASDKIFMKWNSYLSPNPTDDDINDNIYLLEKLFDSQTIINKIKELFIFSNCVNIHHDPTDLININLPVSIGINENITNYYNRFLELKKL